MNGCVSVCVYYVTLLFSLQGLDAHKYSSTWDCVKKIAKNEGFKA